MASPQGRAAEIGPAVFFFYVVFFDIVAIRRDLDGLGGAVSSLKIYK